MDGTEKTPRSAHRAVAVIALTCAAAGAAALPADAWPRWLPAWMQGAVPLAALACVLLLCWRERALRGWLLAAFFAALGIAAWHGTR